MARWTETVDISFDVASIRFDPERECLGTRAIATPTARPYRAEFDKPWVAEAYR